jgi:transposase
MRTVIHKLYPTIKQERYLSESLWSSIGIENWAISQIKNTTENGFPLGCMKSLQIRSILSKRIKGHAKRCGLPSKLLNDSIAAVCETVKRHGINKTRFKQARKKNSFYFAGDIKIDKSGRLKLPNIKTSFRISESNKFLSKLKKVTLIKKVNGWYAACVYDMDRPKIEVSDSVDVGIDPGLSTAITCSNGDQYDFPKFYRDSENLIAKLQRKSKNSKRLKRVQLTLAARRRDHHHKLSTLFAKKYRKVYWSNDNFKALKGLFGKSYSDVSLGMFRTMLEAKLLSRADKLGELVKVSNRHSTQDCSACGSRSGPKGNSALGVRNWVCGDCGSSHHRDVNAAQNTIISGRGATAKV